ncbi:MAG TPA: helix-hairpin-helix domain-containing protein [Thermoanaerobaculia bacterium]
MNLRIARIPIITILALFPALAATASDVGETSGKKVNINQASATQIALLPRVGAKQAERIVEYRKAHGQFAQAEELMEVKGVGEKLFGQLKPYVALSGPTTLTAKVSSRGTRGGPTTRKAASKSASSSAATAASSAGSTR